MHLQKQGLAEIFKKKKKKNNFGIKFFTPTAQIELYGHATRASYKEAWNLGDQRRWQKSKFVWSTYMRTDDDYS